VWASALAWLAAYAFVLQTALAPVAAAALTHADAANSAQFVVCAQHANALDQTQPTAPHDHDANCKFCVGCPGGAALLAPETFVTVAIDVAVSPVHWHAAFHLGPGRDFLAGKQARGPPTLT